MTQIRRQLVYNLVKNSTEENVVYIKLENENFIEQMLQSLFEMNIQSIIIEGGAKTFQSFIDEDLWDEARVITNEKLITENGINAPEIKDFILEKQERYFDDLVSYYHKAN